MRRVRLVDGLERRLARLEGKDLEAATESELLDMLEEVRKTDHRVYKELRRRVEARETLARSCDAKKVGPKVSKIGTYGANIFATNFFGGVCGGHGEQLGSRQREMQAEAASERRRLREQEAEVQQIKRDSGALKRQAELKA
jgi:hypothetical protein